VFAFEPIPPVFEVLSLNARLHGDDRVHVFNCGLSDRPSDAEFTYYPHLSIMSGRFADPANERGVIKAFLGTQQATDDETIQTDTLEDMLTERLELERVTCRLRTVSDIVREHAVARIDLLKVDVEKSELEVLLGIDEDDWPKIRQVVVEVHDVDGRLALIEALLNRHGFTVSVEQDASLRGTRLHNLYARRASIHERPSLAAAPVQATPTWHSARALVDDARALVKRSLV
jgi:FkbM family methyltransferase